MEATVQAAVARCGSLPDVMRQLIAAYTSAALQHHSKAHLVQQQQQQLQQQVPHKCSLHHLLEMLEAALAGPSNGVNRNSITSSVRDQQQLVKHLLQQFQENVCAAALPATPGASHCGHPQQQEHAAGALPGAPGPHCQARSSGWQFCTSEQAVHQPAPASVAVCTFQLAFEDLMLHAASAQLLQPVDALLASCSTPSSLCAALAAARKLLQPRVMLQLLCYSVLTAACTATGMDLPALANSGAALQQLAALRQQAVAGSGSAGGSWQLQSLVQQFVACCSRLQQQQQQEEVVWEVVPPVLVAAAGAVHEAALSAVVDSLDALQPELLPACPALQQLLQYLQEAAA